MSRIVFGCLLAGGVALLGSEARGQEANVLRLKPFVVNDPRFRQRAFSLLVPADWQAEGQVHWRLHPAMPASGSVKAWNPRGVETAHFYANIPFADGVREMAAEAAMIAGPQAMQFVAAQFAEGKTYIGNEVRRFVGGPAEYVTKIVLPRHRPEIKNYRVLGVENMPKWAESSDCLATKVSGIGVAVQAARVRIAYVENGKTIHEDFFILLPRVQMGRVTYWGVESASSVRAEAGRLDPLLKMHQAMLFSLKIDLHWFNRERQVAAMLQDAFYRQQAEIMKLSDSVRKTPACGFLVIAR